MKTYILPEKLKPVLRKIWGIPVFGKRSEVAKKFKKILKEKKFKKVITVGDYCSIYLPSEIKIFDGKIKRRKIKKILKFEISFKNPPGTIQKEAFLKIKEAISQNKNVFIEGEDDLMVIPAVLVSEIGSLVVYGFPKKGICLIKVTKETKKKIKNLLKKFQILDS